jgi:hypothetical protein
MTSTYATPLAYPSCHRTYSNDRWLARHVATHRAHPRRPPPAGTSHAEREIPFSRNHDPLVDDVLMPDTPAADFAPQDNAECASGGCVECFPDAGTPVWPPDDGDEPAGSVFNPSRHCEPFDSEADFILARYMVDFDITDGAMDHLLKTVLPSLGVHHTVRSVHAVKQRIDQMTDGLGHQSWSKNTITMQWKTAHPAPIEFYSRDILRCVWWLLKQPAYADDLVYAPERHFNDAGSRIYGEMHTGDWWWEQQVCPRARRTAHADRGLVRAARGGYGGATHFYVRRDPSHQLRG